MPTQNHSAHSKKITEWLKMPMAFLPMGGEGGLANTQEKLKIKKNESVANHSAMGWAEMGIKTWR